jgi:hypothetical protein
MMKIITTFGEGFRGLLRKDTGEPAAVVVVASSSTTSLDEVKASAEGAEMIRLTRHPRKLMGATSSAKNDREPAPV